MEYLCYFVTRYSAIHIEKYFRPSLYKFIVFESIYIWCDWIRHWYIEKCSFCIRICLNLDSLSKNFCHFSTSDEIMWSEYTTFIPTDPSLSRCKINIFCIPRISVNIRKSLIYFRMSIVTREGSNQHFYEFCTSNSPISIIGLIIFSNSESLTHEVSLRIIGSEIPMIKSTVHEERLYIGCIFSFRHILNLVIIYTMQFLYYGADIGSDRIHYIECGNSTGYGSI